MTDATDITDIPERTGVPVFDEPHRLVYAPRRRTDGLPWARVDGQPYRYSREEVREDVTTAAIAATVAKLSIPMADALRGADPEREIVAAPLVTLNALYRRYLTHRPGQHDVEAPLTALGVAVARELAAARTGRRA